MTGTPVVEKTESAAEIASLWLTAIESAIQNDDLQAVAESVIANDSWWRDLLTLTWDIATFRGRNDISDMIAKLPPELKPCDLTLEENNVAFADLLGRHCVEALFTFRTGVATGRGVVRLVDEDGAWRAWTVLTSMQDLNGMQESRTSINDVAFDSYNTAIRNRETWYEKRDREREFKDSEPTVLIIGAGHAGVMLAARLQHLGVPHLLVDKEERLGDNWRLRYAGLSLHDTCWFARFPYLEYPDNWPLYTPAELMGDWIESYINLLQLNAWVRTEVTTATFDETQKRWDVTVVREGQERKLRPAHVVFATGMAGKPKMPQVPGAESFNGEIVHSSAFTGGRDYPGKKAVVVGAGASGHDVVQSFYEANAATVTLVQRGASYVMSGKNGIPIFHGQFWTENGPKLDDADLLSTSYPWEFQLEELVPGATKMIAELDADLLSGLERAGFATDFGVGHQGMLGAALNGTGGYYIDKGCSQLIVDGDIGLKRGEIVEFTATGVVYSDGTTEDADIVVFCTGWDNTREMARPICGDDVTDQASPIWGVGEDGELQGTFRQSGYPHLWFIVGSTGVVRALSKHVALQILGVESGLLSARGLSAG